MCIYFYGFLFCMNMKKKMYTYIYILHFCISLYISLQNDVSQSHYFIQSEYIIPCYGKKRRLLIHYVIQIVNLKYWLLWNGDYPNLSHLFIKSHPFQISLCHKQNLHHKYFCIHVLQCVKFHHSCMLEISFNLPLSTLSGNLKQIQNFIIKSFILEMEFKRVYYSTLKKPFENIYAIHLILLHICFCVFHVCFLYLFP